MGRREGDRVSPLFRLFYSLSLDSFSSRLVDNFLDFKHLARATFSLSRLPSMLSWGPKLNCADYSGVLCWWSTPLVVWAVGYLQSVKYYTGPDEPLPVTTVTLELMRDTDDRALHQFAAVWDIELCESPLILYFVSFCISDNHIVSFPFHL